MRQSMSSSTERTTQGAPSLPPGGTPSLGLLAGDELGLITRDVVIRTGALAGLLVAWNATEKDVDVICACGTAPSKEGLPLSRKRSGFVGRVLASGHTAGEPITVEQNPEGHRGSGSATASDVTAGMNSLCCYRTPTALPLTRSRSDRGNDLHDIRGWGSRTARRVNRPRAVAGRNDRREPPRSGR
jgi:hypothetical protein